MKHTITLGKGTILAKNADFLQQKKKKRKKMMTSWSQNDGVLVVKDVICETTCVSTYVPSFTFLA